MRYAGRHRDGVNSQKGIKMTESVYGMSQSLEVPESQPTTSVAPESSISSAAPAEKLFKQSEVNDIVKKVKLDAMRVAQERPDYVSQKYQQNDHGISHHHQDERTYQNTNNDDVVRKIAAEEAQRLRDQWVQDAHRSTQEQHAQRIVQDFFTKLSAGKDKYQDFDQVTGDVEFRNFPNVVQLLTGYVDNPEDVMYALGSDRIKMANLEQLSHLSPNDAIVAIRRLSASIKDNQTASKVRMPNEPLSQLKPSSTGTDSGDMAVKDLRRKYRV